MHIPLPFSIAIPKSESGYGELYVTHTKHRSDAKFSCVETDSIIEEIQNYNDTREAFKKKVETVCNSCTTTKQLRDLLPEATPYIPEDAKKMAVSMALVPIEDIKAVRSMLMTIPQEEEKDAEE